MPRVLCFALLAIFVLSMPATGEESKTTASEPVVPVFREPFTLRLGVDKSHYYEEHYDKRIPYVAEGDVYLFVGESFGINLRVNQSTVDAIYQPDVSKADVWFEFSQPKDLGRVSMMLMIKNKTKSRLQMDALMTVPGKKGIYRTSILPIEAGLEDFESWPHPIVQLVLRNFRLSESHRK